MRTLLLILALIIAIPACGQSARQRTIHATYLTTNTAHESFIAFDREYQARIVATATDEAAGRAALDAYRKKRARIVELFDGAWRALAAAAVVSEDPKNLDQLSKATALLVIALRDITGGSL